VFQKLRQWFKFVMQSDSIGSGTMTDSSGSLGMTAKVSGALAISFAVAAVAAAPARADAVSDNFLSALTNSGVSYGDPGTAVSMAQSICPLLAQPGGNFAGVASQMGGTNGVSPGMASLFTTIAISMYCPSMMASIANGNWLGGASQAGIPGLAGLSGIPGI
jgi:phosphoribosylformylglycinamidine (FGAM) synthase-like enzyme